MFFRSLRSLILAIILLIAGSVQLSNSLDYADSAKREVSAVGKLTYVSGGRSSTYEYSFVINGFETGSESGSCRTALSSQGCTVGAPVLVYYDPSHRSSPMLQEFGAASRERGFFGALMVMVDLVLVVLYFIAKRALASPDGASDIDYDKPVVGSEIIHVVPEE